MRKVVIPAAALVALALAFSVALAEDKAGQAAAKSGSAAAKIGQPAPEFSLKDQNGKTVTLSDLKGKTVVLEWFNQGCPYVVRHHKDKAMSKIADTYKDKDVVWLAINTTGKSADENKESAQMWGIQYPILNDTTTQVAQAYGAKTTPHMYIIDKEGKLVYNGAIDDDPEGSKGASAKNFVAQALDEVLAGKPVSTPETKPYGCGVKYKKADS